MNTYQWIFVAVLGVAWWYAFAKGPRWVQVMTGRRSRPSIAPRLSVELYDLLYFGLGASIAVGPILVWPNSSPATMCFFLVLGSAIGRLSAQAVFGERTV